MLKFRAPHHRHQDSKPEKIFLIISKKRIFIWEKFFLGYSPEKNDPGPINIKSSKYTKIDKWLHTSIGLKTVDAVYSLIFQNAL